MRWRGVYYGHDESSSTDLLKLLLTGGTGFLGRGLLRQISNGLFPSYDVTVYSRDEERQVELARRYPFVRCVLGDIRDRDRLATAMAGHDYVIHMAALKFIPEAELNAAECISVNIGGAESVIWAARKAGVQRVVGISTDKAVQPVNIYGASKMALERLFAEASDGQTVFTCTRYGNVIGSTGSVIPLFLRQAAEQGYVTVTHPAMTRFWMSVDEAIAAITIALKTPHAGAVIIPQVKAMAMGNLAAALVGDTEVRVTGLRPGEKMHESLLHHQESVRVLRCSDHLELLPPGIDLSEAGEPFAIKSSNPDFWLEPEQLLQYVEDAKEV